MRPTLIFLAFILFSLIVLQGCIRTGNDIVNENCDDYKAPSSKAACYKSKAYYYAASGDIQSAVQQCEKVESVSGKCVPSIGLDVDYYKLISADSYSTCVKNVVYYAGKDTYTDTSGNTINVCDTIKNRCTTSTIGKVKNLVVKAVDKIVSLFTGLSPSTSSFDPDLETKSCKEIAQRVSDFDDQIKENYKYVFGYSVP